MMNKRLQAVVVMLLFAAPMVGAWVMFKYYPHLLSSMGKSNYGEFVYPVRQMSMAKLEDYQGRQFDREIIRNHWVMLYIDKPDCNQDCRNNLDKIRQVRLAQGKEMGRVKTMFVIAGDGDISHLSEYLSTQANMIVARLGDQNRADWLKVFTQEDGSSPIDTRRVYFVDPLGQLMMYHDLNNESGNMEQTSGMLKDLKKLLHNSKATS